jgi:hypothetical protein
MHGQKNNKFKKYDCESVDDDWNGFKSVLQVGREGYIWVKYR